MGTIFNYPLNLLKKFRKSNISADIVNVGEGAVVNINGKKVAMYRASNNETINLSAVCTHLGCEVGWNNTDKTWDCPCHGARFKSDGTVKQGPATNSLQKLS